jgi:hypothetical protein
MRALSADFKRHGETVIEAVRTTSEAATYLRVVASLQRQEIKARTPEDKPTDEEVELLNEQHNRR